MPSGADPLKDVSEDVNTGLRRSWSGSSMSEVLNTTATAFFYDAVHRVGRKAAGMPSEGNPSDWEGAPAFARKLRKAALLKAEAAVKAKSPFFADLFNSYAWEIR